jgi:putative transposase
VESGEHLVQCLVYIDLNMVRAGVVRHPEQWSFGGYREIQNPKQQYGIIDYPRLITVLGMKTLGGVQESCKERVEEALCRKEQCRQAKWTESLAVGSEQYVGGIQRELGVRAKGRRVIEEGGSHQLRESETAYTSQDEVEKGLLRSNNTFLWNPTSDSSAP